MPLAAAFAKPKWGRKNISAERKVEFRDDQVWYITILRVLFAFEQVHTRIEFLLAESQ